MGTLFDILFILLLVILLFTICYAMFRNAWQWFLLSMNDNGDK